ncbi:MAG: hypothetical protein WBG50_22315 [Desulfomonilaceae bacterium]
MKKNNGRDFPETGKWTQWYRSVISSKLDHFAFKKPNESVTGPAGRNSLKIILMTGIVPRCQPGAEALGYFLSPRWGSNAGVPKGLQIVARSRAERGIAGKREHRTTNFLHGLILRQFREAGTTE